MLRETLSPEVSQLLTEFSSLLACEPSPGTGAHILWMGEMEEIYERLQSARAKIIQGHTLQ
jgi:hypothetical protein